MVEAGTAKEGRFDEGYELYNKAEACYTELQKEEKQLVDTINRLSAQGVSLFE